MDKFQKYKDYKTILSVNALIWCKGKVLMLKRADTKSVDPGLYSSVGGKVEPHESFYDAIIREVEEETGITDFVNIRFYGITQHPYPPTDSEWINASFMIEIKDLVELKPTEDGTFHWLSPEEVKSLPANEDMKKYIEILSKKKDASVLGFFDHDKDGQVTKSLLKIY